jgi:hypothetical protein
MDKAYRETKFHRIVIVGIALFGIVEMAIIRFLFPASYSHLLWLIPAYFLLLGIIVLLVLNRMKRRQMHPGRAIARLMLFNVAQMFVSFILLFLCYNLFENRKEVFILAFSIFYIFFMAVKFYILYDIDRQNKKLKEGMH